ncbi:hypothetical protein JZO82_07195 [Vagococcus fluvialis]|uniref:hypothetical protein n=1 Tax=Vagococcus fluvialis TaxID=2738 RepID=UPI001A8E3918|nr:hypothetical protein [Vagococcus fluvialis]MBO0428937.1 hypothetical protein [Vagococcus fluvialis]
MSNYTLSDYEAAKKSLSSTLRKIEKAIVSLEEKQAEGKNLKAQITLSKERVKALSISLDLIEKEIIDLTKI